MDEKNVIAQEKGMPALLTWVDRATMAPRNAPSICKKLIEKCLCARPKTQEATREVLMIFIEREQPDAVLVSDIIVVVLEICCLLEVGVEMFD